MFSSLRDGQYQFLHKLGTGGMGEVYQARDTKLNRLVAIKVLKVEASRKSESQRRFMQEAQSASGLNHPNIITIYDIFTESGADMLIMEYVAGQTLVNLIPKGGLRTPQVLNYGTQMADALATAHNAGIVHRDLKPGNIMVTESGLVKILDFGLAKIVAPPSTGEDPDATLASNQLTVEGAIIGTVAYMSPEQARGKRVDLRSDIFSFGAVLYEMATGQRAFPGADTVSTLTAVLRDDARPMHEVAPDVPPELDSVIQRCMRKEPDERWQTMKEVWQELMALKQNSDTGTLYRSRIVMPAAPPTQSMQAPVQAPVKKAPVVLIAGLAAVLAAAGAGGWWFVSHRAPPPAETPTVATQQQPAAVPEPQPVPAVSSPLEKVLHNDDVLEMVAAKLPTSLISSQIRTSKTEFKLTSQEVIRLVKGGVPESIIEVMRDPKKASVANSVIVQTPPTTQQTPPPPGAKPSPAGQPPVTDVPVPSSGVKPQANASSLPATSPVAKGTPLLLHDGTPLMLALNDTVAEDASEGLVLHFTVQQDLKVDGTVVVSKGAHALGEIYEAGKKRKLLGRSKMTYRLLTVQAVDGKQVRLRATPTPGKPDDVSRRPMAAKGLMYPAYVDGDLNVSRQ